MKRYLNLMLALFAGLFLTNIASAQAAFDYTTYDTTLTGGLAVIGATAGGIAAISAGVMVWRKIRSYFNRAG